MTKNNNEGSNVAKEPTPVKVTHKTCHGPLHPDGLELPADHFAANPNNGRDGLNSQCKACRKKTRDEVRGKSRQRIEDANGVRRAAQSVTVNGMTYHALTYRQIKEGIEDALKHEDHKMRMILEDLVEKLSHHLHLD